MAKFVVLQERSAGNETVGNAWTDVATFPPTATLAEVWAWAHERGGKTGRTMIRPDENDPPPEPDFKF